MPQVKKKLSREATYPEKVFCFTRTESSESGNFIYPKKFKGFLIAEVLIASFVLTVGLLATTKLITSSLRNTLDSRDTIVAVELAQEGVELVRNDRDNDFASGRNGFTNFNSANKQCQMDYTDASLSGKCQAGVAPLSRYYLQYSSNFYIRSVGPKERYSRYIYIDYSNPGVGQENALVRSFVYWGGASDYAPTGDGSTASCTLPAKCVFTEIKLTNWK